MSQNVFSMTCDEMRDFINKEIVGKRYDDIPVAGTFFTNAIVNVVVDMKDGSKCYFNAVLKDNKVRSFSHLLNRNAGYTVYTHERTVGELFSQPYVETVMSEMERGNIIVKANNLKNYLILNLANTAFFAYRFFTLPFGIFSHALKHV